MIGTTTALILGGLTAGGAIGGAALSSRAAGKAAEAQEDATKYAADLQAKSASEALGFQKEQFATEQENLAPWLQAGKTSLADLTASMGELTKPFDPASVDITRDPGYAFRRDEGLRAIDRSAAARGGALSGGALKAGMRYSSDLASQEYGNAFSRDFNVFQTNQANRFNRLAAIAGIGQTATQQLGAAGQSFAGNASQIALNTGNTLADLATQAGNARASGYASQGNIWGGAVGGIGSSLSDIYLMSKLGRTGGSAPAGTPNSGPPGFFKDPKTGQSWFFDYATKTWQQGASGALNI